MSKKAGEQGTAGTVVEGITVKVVDRIQNDIYRIRFLEDCIATGTIEMSEDGLTGFFLILHEIADDLKGAITESEAA